MVGIGIVTVVVVGANVDLIGATQLNDNDYPGGSPSDTLMFTFELLSAASPSGLGVPVGPTKAIRKSFIIIASR